jgi:ADP-ribose pyrophosphatase YjhB (NUDIX family)
VEGIIREVREELGVEIELVGNPILPEIHTYGPDGGYVMPIGFRANIVEGDPDPTDDVANVRWIPAEEVDSTDFAWEHDRRMVRAALEDT